MTQKIRLTLIYIILLLTIFTALRAQNTVNNKTDANGNRIGKWIIYLDNELKPIETANNARYYKVVNYITGKAIGFVNYYYKSGKLFFQTPVKSIDPDVYSDGEIKYFTESGATIYILNYQNGMLNGQADYFYPDGKPRYHGNYTDDKKTGIWKQWDETGQYGIGAYSDDVPDGEWTFYYADGKLKSQGKFRKGIQTGVWTEYRDNGDIAEGNYDNGVPDGTWVCKYANGKPCYIGSYKKGKKEGFWKEWDFMGQLAQGNYIDNQKDGVWIMSDAQGNKVLEGAFVNDKENGEWKKYDSIGNVIDTFTYQDGKRVQNEETPTH